MGPAAAWDCDTPPPPVVLCAQLFSHCPRVVLARRWFGVWPWQVLPLDLFPNGKEYFEHTRRMFAFHAPCPQCYIVHNNWVVGSHAKVYRCGVLGCVPACLRVGRQALVRGPSFLFFSGVGWGGGVWVGPLPVLVRASKGKGTWVGGWVGGCAR